MGSDRPSASRERVSYAGMKGSPVLEAERFVLRLAERADAPAVLRFVQENREHLAPWEPERPPEYFTKDHWHERALLARDQWELDRGCPLHLFAREDGRVLGHVNLSNVVRGAFQACHLGYAIGREHEGRGVMTEAVRLAIGLAFGRMRLHRVMANYMPRNERSARLLERLGFQKEGLARDYLLIAGRWEDHVLTSLTSPDWSS